MDARLLIRNRSGMFFLTENSDENEHFVAAFGPATDVD